MAPGPGLTINIDEKRYGAGVEPLFMGLRAEIEPSCVTAILGPSGIGKSTLLRIIAGIDEDFRGSVNVDGRASVEPPGYVFQDPRLLPWLTTLDNVRAAGKGIATDQALAALQRTGLAACAGLYPHQLSGGMQRRASLARALALNSGLLFLDEPFVSLDRALVSEMQDLIAGIIKDDKPTTIFVTHMPEDAARLAERVLVLSGRPAIIAAELALPTPIGMRNRETVARYIELIETAVGHLDIRED